MCGIAAFIDFNRKSSEEVLRQMTDTMVHRGPDGAGYFLKETPIYQLGFGHRRLAIIELTDAGAQPMHFEQFSIIFNGEIYNYLEIRKELEALGHQFKSHSDTEVLLQGYARWGKDLLSKLRGMFALVIYDANEQRLFCARDRAGVKPFFLSLENGLLLIASELKAFHKHPNFEKHLDADALRVFLKFGNIPAPHTIFQNCMKLQPGHYMEFSLKHPPQALPEQHCYWSVYDAYNKPKCDLSYEEAIDETEKRLREACEYRMVADVPVGVFLSGGYDSTAVTAMLQSQRTERLKTYTIAVPDMGLNEAPYAKATAQHFGTDHTEMECSVQEAIDFIPQLPFFYDEPFADSSAIPTALVSKIARKEVTVALSADGGDELFAGYNRYAYMEKYAKSLSKMPDVLRKGIGAVMGVIPADYIPFLRSTYNFHNRYEKMKGLLSAYADDTILLSLSENFTEVQVDKLLLLPSKRIQTAYDSKSLEREHYSLLAYAQAMDYTTYLPDDILTKVDRATMAASLEGREPLLDHVLTEWAAQLPDAYKYHNGVKKRILRDIVHRYIPAEMMQRPKMGFAIPIAKWMQHELKDLLLLYLNEDYLRRQGIFQPKQVKQLLSAFLNGKQELDTKLWYLLMFQLWYAHWMEEGK